MTRTKKIVKSVAEYFAKKGEIMNMKTYIAQDDAPHRARAIRKLTGSWARMIQIIKVNFPEEYEKATKPAPAPKPSAKPKFKAKPKIKANSAGKKGK
jgi:hypothetical protein|tara:strand:- start:2550 stop:2840 length:291 start_codon:yes stop_codon:yes gene_type:complete